MRAEWVLCFALEDTRLNRHVAIKFLPSDKLGSRSEAAVYS